MDARAEGGDDVSTPEGSSPLSPEALTDMQQKLSAPILFPKEFKQWLTDYVATNIPMIPFSQIFGSHLNLARSGDHISASESKTATSYGDLTTVGPQLTGLGAGTYLIMYGAYGRAKASISFNGAAASDDDSFYTIEGSTAGARGRFKSFADDKGGAGNTLCMKYKNGTFSNRWLFVIRLGPPDATYA
jgi:hypothetical protein